MIGRDELMNFKEMWTWLIAHPAHDREYYINHVMETDEAWMNACPLADSDIPEKCRGCGQLWEGNRGTLCTDPDAPLYKWQNTSRQLPDERSYYASQIAVLAMKLIRRLGQRVADCALCRKAA